MNPRVLLPSKGTIFDTCVFKTYTPSEGYLVVNQLPELRKFKCRFDPRHFRILPEVCERVDKTLVHYSRTGYLLVTVDKRLLYTSRAKGGRVVHLKAYLKECY